MPSSVTEQLTLEQQWSLLLPPRRHTATLHFVEYAYCRLIPVLVLPSTSHTEIIRMIAAREKHNTSDYRFLSMSSKPHITTL